MNLKKFAGSNKGVTLILVIVILMVVAILADILIETAFQNYKMGKASGYTDYSYYAGESAIQKCFDILYNKCADPAMADTNHIVYDGADGQFAKAVVNSVLAPYIAQLSLEGNFKGLDVKDDPSNKADVDIQLQYLGYSRNETTNPGKIKIKIGLTAQSSYVVKPFLSSDKTVYAKEEFLVTIPNGFKLRGPVYSIGDLMADQASNVDILGDVHVYGTSPEYLKQPEQYYYGGIYAKSNSQMRIRGNAYSRSFIRTGQYSGASDASSIFVYKDAIAQCLQIFGRGQRIAVMRNAYTFDDLEVNGEDSVLAVNGSYFGLSDGSDGSYHDNSSAIINSATLHYLNSPDSQKSRIVVNGAVMLNGGTFRINEASGDTLYQIEDASIAWFTDPLNPSPVYKNAPVPLPSDTTYVDWLEDNGYDLTGKGFGNLFQTFNMMPWNMDSTTADSNFNSWLAKIDAARQAGNSNISSNYDLVKPDKIQGFSNYVLASNDDMYFMKKNNENDSELKKAQLLSNNFIVDNILPPDTYSSWNNYWDYYVDNSYAWNGGYCTEIPGILNNIMKPKLLHQANIFVEREIVGNTVKSGGEVVKHKSDNVFNKLETSLAELISTSPSNPYIIEPSDGAYSEALDGTANLSNPGYPYNDLVINPWAQGQYFLIVNDDPNLELVLDGTTFNGIIFTTGKVILKNGAVVNGAIVAAGKGYDSVNGVEGSAAETSEIGGVPMMIRAPRIKEDGSNIGVLDSGGYAAVYCTSGDVAIHFPDPDPDLGRTMLLDEFKNQDASYPIDLYNIF